MTDSKYGYSFKGWDKDLVAVTGVATYTAQYDETLAKYTIKFVDGQGNELETKELEYGVAPTFTGTLPTVPANDAKYTYTAGWDKEFAEVVEDATYTYNVAVAATKHTVTINHLNLDGSVAAEPFVGSVGYNLEELYDGYYTYTAPTVAGKMPNQDYLYYTVGATDVVLNIYYSEVDVLTDATVASASLAGAGTQDDPYLISSAADLLYLDAQVDAGEKFEGFYFKLTKSIDLNNITVQMNGTFSGTLDGNNCSIRGLYISSEAGNTALIYALGKASTVKNLSLYGQVTETANNYCATLAALAYGIIDNVANYCTVNGYARVGGIAAAQKGGKIINSANYGSVTGTSSRVGGFVGWSDSAGTIENSYNFGKVYALSDVAGIIGYIQGSKGSVINCINFGEVEASNAKNTYVAAGVVAYASMKGIEGCINYGYIHSIGYSASMVGRLNGTAAYVTNCTNYGHIEGSKWALATVEGLENALSIVAWDNGGAAATLVTGCHDYGTITKL